jgi:hypothetical protein
MSKVDAICTASTLHRALGDSEHNAIALTEGHNHRSRLHAGPLLGHYEFSTGKVSIGLRQKDGKLERKNMLTVEILMKAVVITGLILQ